MSVVYKTEGKGTIHKHFIQTDKKLVASWVNNSEKTVPKLTMAPSSSALVLKNP